MTRADFAEKLASRLNVTKKEADQYLLSFMDAIMSNLEKDRRVVLQGFGSFHLREYRARLGKKPISCEPLKIPARKKPLFQASKELRDIINRAKPQHRSVVKKVSLAQATV